MAGEHIRRSFAEYRRRGAEGKKKGRGVRQIWTAPGFYLISFAGEDRVHGAADIEQDKPAYLLFHGCCGSGFDASRFVDLLNVDHATHMEPFCVPLWDTLG